MSSSCWSASEPAYDPEFEEMPEKVLPHELPTERLAVVSLVAGIAGFFLPIVGPVTAIVSGHVARGEIRKAHGRLGGDALAKTGLVLGYVWLGLTALATLVMVAAMFFVVTHVETGSAEVRVGEAEEHRPKFQVIERAGVLLDPSKPRDFRVISGDMLFESRDVPVDPESHPRTTIRIYRPQRSGSLEGISLPPIPPIPPVLPDAT